MTCESSERMPQIVPPEMLYNQPAFQQLRERRREMVDLVKRKVQRARLLHESKQYSESLELCGEVLIIDPSNRAARELRKQCLMEREDHADQNMQVTRRIRDAAALREVSRDGLIPERDADLPRPVFGYSDMPFRADLDLQPNVRNALNQRIPEVNLIDADINYLLQLLFKTTGVNILYDPSELEGKTVTLHGRNMTLEKILKFLSRSYGLGYTLDGDIIHIYAAGEKGAQALMTPAIIPLKTGLTSTGGGGEEGGPVTSEIEATVKWMEENWPGWPPETRWLLDRKLNRLIVCSTPGIVEDVRKIVDMLDVPPVQVMIATQFVNVGEKTFDQLGFSWELNANPDAKQGDFVFGGSANQAVTTDGGLNMGMVGTLDRYQLQATMSALISKTGAKVLTAPRVIALNNHAAKINLARKYPFPTDWEVVESSATTEYSAAISTTVIPTAWQEQDLGFLLEVHPSVGADMKTVTLQVIPEITDLQDIIEYKIVTTTSDGEQREINAERPVFSTNTVEVEAVVEDGHTIVIGGLFRDNLTEEKKTIPGFDRIPLLRHLFKSKDNKRERSCLLIFVTANIVTPGNRLYTDRVASAMRNLEREQRRPDDPADISAETVNRWLGDPRLEDDCAAGTCYP